MSAIEKRLELARAAVHLAWRVGEAILVHYRPNVAVSLKEDATPVTAADREADRLLVEGLAALAPEVPVVSEERLDPALAGSPPSRFFLVDPLDGTRQFIQGLPEFTINIALVEDHRPVLGIVHLPVAGRLYWTAGDGRAWRQMAPDRRDESIRCRVPPADGLTAVMSRSHLDDKTVAYLATQRIRERCQMGSAMKFCLLAEGSADLYVRHGPTMEWDTAAGHAIVEAAGGEVRDVAGGPLLYGKPGLRNGGFIATGRASSS